MRIGIDSRPLREPKTSGIPAYVRNLLKHLAVLDKKNEYFLYAHKDIDFVIPNNRWKKKTGALTRYGSVWMQAELPFWFLRDGIDIFWGTQHTLPVRMPKRTKAVLTVHDLIHLVFPETMRMMNYIINKLIIPPSIHRSNVIVSISNWTLNDVKHYFNPQNKKMVVTHLGVGEEFYPRDKVESQKRVMENFNIPGSYLLTVGTFEPRKNIIGTFRSFKKIASKIPHHLVVVGQKGWKNKKILQEMKNNEISDRIHILGYVPDPMLPYVYSGADLFIFPSLYEGFGIPPLEAMACAVPVVASNVSSIPEVVNEAAVLVNPYDTTSIANGILQILGKSDLRLELIERGLKQSAQYTWRNTAEKMLEIFECLNPQNEGP